ncbi:uncharacterized protein LOC118645514 [Monomorium pharaonis]|uniref:uncharacterized protein LOC118645514 n=1 Tax=Monomorium pharaonis TaxID=307658 RepID=UPI001747B6EB|nr:uncharacterized protein LOC118645514 [Monomorium pharaonis]
MYSTLAERQSSDTFDDGNAKRKNSDYANKENTKKKQTFNNVNARADPPRVLARRYTLTKTGYKYLDIGIVVKSPSYVNIVLGDCHGKEISFTIDEWKELVKLKSTILTTLRSNNNNNNNNSAEDSMELPTIGNNIFLRVGKINNLPILRLEHPSNRLILSLSTVIIMFDHDYCVDRIVKALSPVTRIVDAKVKRFQEIAAGLDNPADGPRAIRESAHFDANDIVDCELAVICFGFF